MQLAAAVLPAAAAGQDGSVGRHRRAAAALSAHQHHHGSGPAQHHHHGRPAQGILSAFLGRNAAGARSLHAGATTRTVAASAAAVATVTAAVAPAAQQQQQQRAPDLGYPRTLLKEYVLLQQIGKGGNGVVALAQRRDELEAEGTAARKFAVKSLPKVLKDGSELKRANHLKAVQREITVLKRLRGSLNVVSLEAVYEDDTHVHLVMEHCAGGELTVAIGERHHSERAVASYMRAVLRTLAQCHAHHILHRDIKPGNFMLLSSDDRAPIRAIDFGLAMPYDPEELPCTNLGLEGTPWFMAPEVLSSKVLPASDLWSAGVMCFQLLTGRMPFDDKLNPGNPSLHAIWRSILFDEVDFTKPWWRGISAEAKDFVRLLLQRDADKRPTAKEALKHAWLAGDSSDRSSGRKLQRSVVARIQRFAGSSVFKRSVLQMIAMELQRHPECHLGSHGSADWSNGASSSAASLAAAAAPGATCNPVPASLSQLYASLDFDPRTDDVPAAEVASALKRLGFRLTDDETERLLEQLDPAGSGRVARAALAASQMDWRQLQAQDQRRWVDVARRVFSALDADADGVLKVRELTEHVLRVLPGDEGEMAELVRQAVEEAADAEAAAQHEGDAELDEEGRQTHHHELLRADVDALLQATDLTAGGVPGHPAAAAAADVGMDFAGFLRLLKASSVDSLDMYDDRAALGASLHSVDRLNSALQRSGTATSALASLSGSRHGTRHGSLGFLAAAGSMDSSHGGSTLAGGSVHGGGGGAARRSVDAGPEGVRNALYGRESLWRFEVGGAEGEGAAAGARAGGASAPMPIAGAREKQQAAVPAWRFDVAGAGSGVAAAPPAAPAWRFDVAGAGSGGRPAALGGDAVAVQGVAAKAGGAGAAGPWRFDVGETRAAAAAAASGHGLFPEASPGAQGGDGFSSLSSSHEQHEGLALAALVLQTPPGAGGAERNGAGGGRGPLGGWYDARQHGSKLYAASALGRRGPPGALPPVNE